jgi:hypothetical protein
MGVSHFAGLLAVDSGSMRSGYRHRSVSAYVFRVMPFVAPTLLGMLFVIVVGVTFGHAESLRRFSRGCNQSQTLRNGHGQTRGRTKMLNRRAGQFPTEPLSTLLANGIFFQDSLAFSKSYPKHACGIR